MHSLKQLSQFPAKRLYIKKKARRFCLAFFYEISRNEYLMVCYEAVFMNAAVRPVPCTEDGTVP